MKYNCMLLLIIGALSCNTTKKTTDTDDGKIELVIVQVNDVYEIAPVSGGDYGGMARIASLKKEQLRLNPNTFLLMAGDFLSPSVYNSLRYEGKRIRGKQMVEAMNAAGFDLVGFGNHEFDIQKWELQERLDESSFQWIASNSYLRSNDSLLPFYKNTAHGKDTLPAYRIISIRDKDGTSLKVGFIGINIPSNMADYVAYSDPLQTAIRLYSRIKDSCDIVIPITHQTFKQDSVLASAIPGLPIIIGGHEHDMRFKKIGNVFITKANANARTAFVIKIAYDKNRKAVSVQPRLRSLDNTVPLDSFTSAVVTSWATIAKKNYQTLGFDPMQIILEKGDSLDGREINTRRSSTNLTRLIVDAMAAACPQAQVALLNAGSIRLDDVLYPPISQYDILRSLPFGGSIREVDMKGSLLKQILAAGTGNIGTGGYLQHNFGAQVVDTSRIYRVALTDYLLTGAESNLGFLQIRNPLISNIYPEEPSSKDPRSDVRLAVVRYLRKD